MIVECAWCGAILGEKDGLGSEGVTSGICARCSEAIAAEKDAGPEAVLPQASAPDEPVRAPPRASGRWARRSAGGRG